MNINKVQVDDLNVVVSVQIGADDYGTKVNDILRDYRRKANMPGFRPGKVPEGLIRKMYGKAVLIDEINKIVSESLQDYIKEQELKLLGEPLPNISGDDLDWEIGNEFTFEFEMGLTPVFDVNLSEDDKLTKYRIAVGEEIVNNEVSMYASRFGQMVEADSVADFTETLHGDIVELNADGLPKQDEPLFAEDTALFLKRIQGEELKKPFADAKTGDEIVINLSETFANEWDIVSILKKNNKDELGDISGVQFKFTVDSIEKHVNAELDQKLFEKVFRADAPTTLEEFENRIKKGIEAEYEESCMAKFVVDTRKYLLQKFAPPMPEEFLCKWLKFNNKEIEEEVFEREFPLFLESMRKELIVNTFVKQNDLKIDEAEVVEFAKAIARRQYAMYGLRNVADEDVQSMASNMLKEEKTVRELASQLLERKAVKKASELVDLTVVEMSIDEYNQMISEANKTAETAEETVEATEDTVETAIETVEAEDQQQ